MTAKEYKLVPASAPRKRGPKSSLYADIVSEFLASGEACVRVDLPEKAANTIAIGLKRALDSLGATARARRRGDSVYLER